MNTYATREHAIQHGVIDRIASQSDASDFTERHIEDIASRTVCRNDDGYSLVSLFDSSPLNDTEFWTIVTTYGPDCRNDSYELRWMTTKTATLYGAIYAPDSDIVVDVIFGVDESTVDHRLRTKGWERDQADSNHVYRMGY